MPCNNIATEILTTTLSKPDEDCHEDLEAQTKYLGQSNWVLYTNKERFNPEGYGEEAIEQYSTIINKQFDENIPSWHSNDLQIVELEDETTFLQLGYEEESQHISLL